MDSDTSGNRRYARTPLTRNGSSTPSNCHTATRTPKAKASDARRRIRRRTGVVKSDMVLIIDRYRLRCFLTKAWGLCYSAVVESMVPYVRRLRLTGLGKRWIGAFLLALLIGAYAGCSPQATNPATDTVYDFSINAYQGQDVIGGESILLSQLQGQPIILNFWAGLCPPCRAEMPEFQHFSDEYTGRALVVGVDLGQFFSLGTQEDATALLNELAVSYPAGYTDDASVVRELGVLALPATFFINPDGSLHRKWQGVLNGEKLAEITDEMLAQ